MKTIAVAHGDGIGVEIMDAVLQIFEAAKVPLQYDFVEMGKAVFLAGYSNGMTENAQNTIEKHGVLFKGPMETPKGTGVKSINVTARKFWNTYANLRVFSQLPGVQTIFTKSNVKVDMTIVRENIEDTYGGIEHFLTEDVAVGRRIISRPGSEKVHRFAFEYAKQRGFDHIYCGHKANIMKLTDGLFLKAFYEVAKDYPEVEARDIIVDDLAMKMVRRPEMFKVIVLPNLQGDVISDLCAGLVGGLGFAPSANIGDHVSIFEAVHGTAPDIAGQNLANPTALLLSGIFMLYNLGLTSYADRIEQALLLTLTHKYATADFAEEGIVPLGCSDFAGKIIGNLDNEEIDAVKLTHTMKPLITETSRPTQAIVYPKKGQKIEPKGVDVFVDFGGNPDDLAKDAQTLLLKDMELQCITNRGTMVWPTGSIMTELTAQYCLRLVSKRDNITRKELIEQVLAMEGKLCVCSLEILIAIDGEDKFTAAQGQ